MCLPNRGFITCYSKPCTFNFGMLDRHADISRRQENHSIACLGSNPASPGQMVSGRALWDGEPNKSLETIKKRVYRVSGTGHKQKEWCIIIPTRKTKDCFTNNPFSSLERIKSLKFDFLEAVAICLDEVLKVFRFFSPPV